MQMTATADRYLADRVNTASPAELTGMLYDALCANVRGGITRLEEGRRVDALAKLLKAQDILLELRSTLNPAAGPLAGQLDALYTFAWRRLMDAATSGKAKPAKEALDVVEPLRSAWRQACLGKAA